MKNRPGVNYISGLENVKQAIQECTLKSFLETNTQTLTLYWKIGQTIIQQQDGFGRGAKVIDHLAIDLKQAFPHARGFSVRNLNYMRQFAASYPDLRQVQTQLNHLSWYHHITLISKVAGHDKRLFYIRKTIKNRWSRDEMLSVIKEDISKQKKRSSTGNKESAAIDKNL